MGYSSHWIWENAARYYRYQSSKKPAMKTTSECYSHSEDDKLQIYGQGQFLCTKISDNDYKNAPKVSKNNALLKFDAFNVSTRRFRQSQPSTFK